METLPSSCCIIANTFPEITSRENFLLQGFYLPHIQLSHATRDLPLWSQTPCTLMERKPFRLTKSLSFLLGPKMKRIYVPSIQPIIPGTVSFGKKPFLYSLKTAAVVGHFMNILCLADNSWETSWTARETVDLSTPTVSPMTWRKLPLA